MELIERLDELKLNDNNKYFLDDTINEYVNYLNKLKEFDPKLLKYFLETLREMELINNHETEYENTMLLMLHKNSHRENSIKKIIKLYSEKDNLTKEDLKLLHKILMQGTQNDLKEYDFRHSDNEFVGTYNSDGSKNILYMPINSNEIDENMDKVLEYLNSNNITDPFITPFIVHGLISVMQPFYDGNTRLSRLVQYASIWKNTNNLYNTSFPSPTIFLSKNYLLTRAHYRALITDLATNKDNEAWNKWITYNLNMVNEQLYYLNNNIKKVRQ